MRKLIVHEFMSLDGVVQAPGGQREDRDGGFAHGGWTGPYWHELHVLLYPLTLGGGKRILPTGVRRSFRLTSAMPYPSGVVGLHYARQES